MFSTSAPYPAQVSYVGDAVISVDVSSTQPDGTNDDLTTATVEFALLPANSVDPSNWTAGTWATSGAGYSAQISQSALTPAVGEYVLWIQVTTESLGTFVGACGPLIVV